MFSNSPEQRVNLDLRPEVGASPNNTWMQLGGPSTPGWGFYLFQLSFPALTAQLPNTSASGLGVMEETSCGSLSNPAWDECHPH